MPMSPRAVLAIAFVAATVVFCVVQDRVTAEGARQYVALHQAGTPVTLDEVVAPAVRRSLRQGVIWGGVVLAAGIVLAIGRRV
jgi:hypothetical protein